MANKPLTNVVASVISIIFLCTLITCAVAWVSTDGDYFLGAVICNVVAIVFIVAEWKGLLSKGEIAPPKSWGMWLGIFALGLVLSVVFIVIDCGGHFPVFHPKLICDGHPGFSLVFTFGALCLTAIALPNALRSWIILNFTNNT